MKFIKIIIALLLVVSVLPACKKLLDRKPISTLTEENFYRNTKEVEDGVIGAYAALRPVYNGDYILAGLRSDDSYISESEGDINQIDGFAETPTNSYVANYWQNSYFAIKQCNTVLKYLGNVTDATKKNYFEGEVKFIRAHLYFNLVRLFGDVPLVLSDVSYNDPVAMRRIGKDTVYNQVIADFQAAIAKLPAQWGQSEVARVNAYAAKGMLAKVYLTLKKYPEAKALLVDLYTNPGPYILQPSFKNIFGINNEMNSEIMYAVRFKSASNNMGNTFTYDMDKLSGSVGFRSASDLRGGTLFPTSDTIRRNQTWIQYANSSGSISWYCIGKYQDPNSLKNDGGADFIVLRYADVILMLAEVLNEMDGTTPLTAADATNPNSRLYLLNLTRKRANPAATNLVYAYNASAINSQANFRTAIKNERRREFAQEDQRWYDLLRWNDAVTAMNAHFTSRAIPTVVQQYQALYPIPQREIDVSGHILVQNPGY
jgi:starch-binding outer membrane protein, SusD/RagB family